MKITTAQPVMDLLPVALRDTARTVVALRKGNPPSLHVLRGECDDQVVRLRDELLRRGQPHDVIDDALYAQCALLDEVALRSLRGEARDEWEREPLQVGVFGRNDAGEELLRRIGQRLREPRPVLPLLAIFAAVLKHGFTGRFAVNEAEARTKLIRAIDGRLERAMGGVVPDRAGPLVVSPSRSLRSPLSSLTWVLIACIAAGLGWFVIDRWLLSSIAGMGH
ncbi:type VI secretion system protein ImpK [Paraburkholderia eburnea]|uniref:Type VI secretion system protein ImpK n=1 Tax=Paraburkholderia eburnea TaxID=1189126 RepID=A0A2S4MJV5_9BURK|nr:DotU/TssL family secretion system protein [Paraburkholderia eburnea]POR55064.1 type VI secretion system protein ImpK [Paraburkholderia eburnea]PRZ24336.1 type VI secretion system protein ImpK [Paraburkholderia eburnea]